MTFGEVFSMHVAARSLLIVALVAPLSHLHGAPPVPALPNVIAAPRPDYSVEASRRRLTGTAIVVVDIDPKTGFVGRVTLQQSTGSRLLDRLTLRALTKWRFRPETATRVAIPVRFSPNGVEIGGNLDPDRVHAFSGTLEAVDAAGKSITVKGRRGTDVILLGAGTKLSRSGRPATIKEATVGREVRGTARVTPEMRGMAVTVELK